MRVGIPKEIKVHEYRVGATPELVRLLCLSGHHVKVEHHAGERIGFADTMYEAAGAEIVLSPSEVFDADMIVKVKEPQLAEVSLMKEGQLLFCFLHLVAEPQLAQELLKRKCIAIAYETVTNARRQLPLLLPMSEIAGRVSIQVGATALQMNHGGRGVLLGGVPGSSRGKVVVVGGGVSGTEAARMAIGLGAEVIVLEKNLSRLRELDKQFFQRICVQHSTQDALEEALVNADLLIGAVLLPGRTTPKLITRKMLSVMNSGAVIVDIAIDQGGCCETSKPTALDSPIYRVDGVIHYCVTNIPGACARTATQALISATSEYVLALANKGYVAALRENAGLMDGLNLYRGQVAHPVVAGNLGYTYQRDLTIT